MHRKIEKVLIVVESNGQVLALDRKKMIEFQRPARTTA